MHATALAFDGSGRNLLVGTESPRPRPPEIAPDEKGLRAARFTVSGGSGRCGLTTRASCAPRPSAAATAAGPARPGSTTAAATRPETSRARNRDRHSRGHFDLHRRCVQRRRHLRVGPRGSPCAERSDLSHHAGRSVGSTLGVARRLTLRSRLRRPRAAHRRHRQQRQDLPAGRRPAPAHAARRRRRATGNGAVQGSQRPSVFCDRQSWKAFPSRFRSRRAGDVRVRAPRRANRRDVGRDQLARHGARKRPRRVFAVGQHRTPDDTGWSRRTPWPRALP